LAGLFFISLIVIHLFFDAHVRGGFATLSWAAAHKECAQALFACLDHLSTQRVFPALIEWLHSFVSHCHAQSTFWTLTPLVPVHAFQHWAPL
jgi:hypothetical protein